MVETGLDHRENNMEFARPGMPRRHDMASYDITTLPAWLAPYLLFTEQSLKRAPTVDGRLLPGPDDRQRRVMVVGAMGMFRMRRIGFRTSNTRRRPFDFSGNHAGRYKPVVAGAVLPEMQRG